MESKHYHHCIECFDTFECHMECSIEYDLSDGDRLFGDHCQCFECEPMAGFDDFGRVSDLMTPAWYKRYYGCTQPYWNE